MGQRIVISSGDINGIGPEIILKGLRGWNPEDHSAIILSSPAVIDFYREKTGIDFNWQPIDSAEEAKSGIYLLKAYDAGPEDISPGELTTFAGKCAMQAVEKGIRLCNKGLADALVTAPISKEAVNRAGYPIPGHTEFLAKHTGTADFMMMLVNDGLRVGLNSVHIPIEEVKHSVSQASIIRHAEIMDRSLRQDFGIPEPDIAVLGLNPHAGDGGIIGREEIDIITPAIRKLQDKSMQITGPHPADAFFGNKKYQQFDGILAMYHDQGLIPFKTLSFGKGVNFTAGLPIVRTSPDHGTAFDIAGRGTADAGSFKQALKLAVELSLNRKPRNV